MSKERGYKPLLLIAHKPMPSGWEKDDESGYDNTRAVVGADFPWFGAAGGFPVGGAVGAVAEGMGGKKLRC